MFKAFKIATLAAILPVAAMGSTIQYQSLIPEGQSISWFEGIGFRGVEECSRHAYAPDDGFRQVWSCVDTPMLADKGGKLEKWDISTIDYKLPPSTTWTELPPWEGTTPVPTPTPWTPTSTTSCCNGFIPIYFDIPDNHIPPDSYIPPDGIPPIPLPASFFMMLLGLTSIVLLKQRKTHDRQTLQRV